MRALALDVGSKTIGLALSDASGTIASAWETLARKGTVADCAELVRRVSHKEVEAVVVGWPLELDGKEGRRAKRVQVLIDALAAALPQDVALHKWDERFSTAAAERTLLEADVSRAGRKAKIDALAAQFILEGWLGTIRRGAP